MADSSRVRGVYGGPLSKRLDVPLTRDVLDRMGQCLVESFVREAKKDFAKRGWSGQARDGSSPIWDSFSYRIKGDRTIEVVCTFPDIEVLTTQDIPSRRMTWLTQEAKKESPEKYALTPRERELGKKKHSKSRLPLVVPIKDKDTGDVVFRMAPLKTQDAWIHPGIAKFTFVQRAVRKGKVACAGIVKGEVVKAVASSLDGSKI